MPRGSVARNRIDLSNEAFGVLKVLAFAGTRGRRATWSCKCVCGNVAVVEGKALRSGHTTSCGCRARAWKHGLHRHRFYYTYQGMMKRCFNEKHVAFSRYGGRGVTVCPKWANDMASFLRWCDSKLPIPDGHTIDRRNNDGNYSPRNCHFVSKAAQQRNSRRYLG